VDKVDSPDFELSENDEELIIEAENVLLTKLPSLQVSEPDVIKHSF
jgi:hypothetical protein